MTSLARSLNARLVGQGSSTLILSHGFGTNQSAWAKILPSLTQRYRVLTFDLACAGTAEVDAFDAQRHGDLLGYAEDLLKLINELRISRCTFVGHSVSGMIGLLAANLAPERFDQLVMIGASPHYLNDGPYQGGMTRETVVEIFDAIASTFRDWTKVFAPFATGRDLDHPITQDFVDSLLAMRPDIALIAAKAILLSDLREKVGKCSAPTVILQSLNDAAVPRQVAEFLHRNISDSQLEFLDTVGHLPHLSDPLIVTAALQRHLNAFASG